jgi:ankyrin repeat protein
MRRLLTLVIVGLIAAQAAMAADRPALLDAAKSGDREAVRRLLKGGADANAPEGDGATALFWAAYHDDLETADLLLRAGAKVNAANDLGATPLWIASMNASAPMVRRLLQAGANPNAALLAGETPLMVAARSGSVDVVEQLIAKGAKVNVSATRGQTPLMWAAAQKHPAVVKALLAHGADLHAKSNEWKMVMAVTPHGMLQYNAAIPHGHDTALLFATRVGDMESAKLLVEAGANVNDADAWGVSATALAAHAGFRPLVEYFLDKGADANVSGAGFTALHAAVMRRDERMVAALLAHGADPNAPVKNWTPTRRSSRDWNFNPEFVGATPYWLAARVTHPGIMRLLADKGADTKFVLHVEYHAGDPIEKRSQTTNALMAATGMGAGFLWYQPERAQREALALESVKLALEQGADLNAKNDDGRTALDQAQLLKYESVIKFLTDNGAKPGAGNANQRRQGPPVS